MDEAYRLMPACKEGENDYGAEALEEIMAVMDSGRVVVIFAGEGREGNEKWRRVWWRGRSGVEGIGVQERFSESHWRMVSVCLF